MSKITEQRSLLEMSLEELWRLFPIILSDHRSEWKEWAKEEISYLSELLREYSPTLSHIGSTAIPGIVSKPIVDILVEISPNHDWYEVRRKMEQARYICMSESGTRMSFNKGYTPDGYAERVFHIHFHVPGDNQEIIFRDYLTAHPDSAKEYEDLKIELADRFRNDRDSYTASKSDFVNRIILKATQTPDT